MQILLVDCDLGEIPGHDVRRVSPKPGLVQVRDVLGDAGTPDLIVQRERLGPRVFLSGLDDVSCTKIFWSVDSHLNLFWHRWYGRLFDVVLTPHVSLFEALPIEWRLPDVRRFVVPGYQREWRPHAERSHTAAFVGILDKERPLRVWLAELLRERHGVTAQRLTPAAMLDLYDDTRLIPNEAICGEVNFRLMEGASCGCCVLTPDSGDDLCAIFDPGREVLVYRHALELDELLTFFGKRPDLSGRIGRAAQQRVLAEHVPEHGAARLVGMAGTASHGCTGEEARRALLLARIQWARSRPESRTELPDFLPLLGKLEPHPEATAMCLRLLAETGRHDAVRNLLYQIFQAKQGEGALCPPDFLDGNLACAGAALRLNDFALFRLFWLRQHQEVLAAGRAVPEPDSLFQGCLLWADLLARADRVCQPGFLFDPGCQCPETAWDMLSLAESLAPDQETTGIWARKAAVLGERTPFVHSRLGCRARCSLNAPNDWRARLEYAHACLCAFRLEQGLAELAEARAQAVQAGQERHFARLLDRYALPSRC